MFFTEVISNFFLLKSILIIKIKDLKLLCKVSKLYSHLKKKISCFFLSGFIPFLGFEVFFVFLIYLRVLMMIGFYDIGVI
jgi:hypothetical protein